MPKINLEKLAFLLKRKKDTHGKSWTQARLIKECGPNVSAPTIKRAMSGKVSSNENTCEEIARALGVADVQELFTPPDHEQETKERLRTLKMLPFRGALNSQTFWNFDTITARYGLSMKSQLDLAPLAIALLAEGSLAARTKRLAEIEGSVDTMVASAKGHLAFAKLVGGVAEGIWCEAESIRKRDLFGRDISNEAYEGGYDPEEGNPLADYLEEFAAEVGLKDINFWAGYVGLRDDGLPDYRLGDYNEVADGSPRVTMALEEGYVRRKDIPQDLSEGDRLAWIEAKVPEADWQSHLLLLANVVTSLEELSL